MTDSGPERSLPPEEERADFLPAIQVLMADQRRRAARGDSFHVEAYLEKYPSLASDPDGLLDLIYHEVVLREERGESPALSEFQSRFPGFATPLEDLFMIHGAIEQGSLEESSSSLSRPRSVGGREPVELQLDSFSGYPTLEGYEIVGVLGSGGMGVVYKARDLRREVMVAIKTMKQVDVTSVARFKQEFRGLLDVSHPNLVSLYELLFDGREWFIVMELIDGVTFLEHIRTGPRPQAGQSIWHSARNLLLGQDSAWTGEPVPFGVPRPALEPGRAIEPSAGDLTSDLIPVLPLSDEAESDTLSDDGYLRLRSAMKQLTDGLIALHHAGKLHRDIKPSNVMVTREGRVILMDFGLMATRVGSARDLSTEGQFVGTAAYMAPEQASGAQLTPAADWYSVGGMLYEALTGRRPFTGELLAVLMEKQRKEPPPPRAWSDKVPDDLNSLCIELLRRDPQARPTGPDVLSRLGATPVAEQLPPTAEITTPSGQQPFVGRESQRAELGKAFEATTQGHTVLVFVQGQSGVGKTALVGRFLDDLAQRPDTVVLAGRCYERESVPYKALDSLIDALSRYLRHLPPHEAEALLPRDVGPLIRVFPVLGRVPSASGSPRRSAPIPDPQELRRRAYAALRELLGRLGDRKSLVLAIDDLQWGDQDSLAVLTEILRSPEPPVLLLLACFRSEEMHESPFLLAMREGPIPKSVECRDLVVGPLSKDESRALARLLVTSEDANVEQRSEIIAREAAGNPLFVAELARSAQSQETGEALAHEPGKALALDEVLWSRVLRLPIEARKLLAVVAVLGGTIRADLAWQCLNEPGDERAALSLLRTGRLIRVSGRSSDVDQLEAYHDRVREAVVAHLSPIEKKECHGRLATVLEAAGEGDHEVLGVNYREAGDLKRAGVHFGRAADEAVEALAFERASTLYRTALELGPESPQEAQRLRVSLAESLANAGRGADAAQEYLKSCEGASRSGGLELRRRAAMQHLISGHIDRGLETMRDVLASVGMTLPTSARRAMISMLWHRTRLAMQGLRFRPRTVDEIPAAVLTKVDVCWSAAIGLSNVDWIRGADFHARCLLLTLQAGEPSRVARSFSLEAAQTATAGVTAHKKTAKLLNTASTLAENSGQPYAIGMALLAEGVSSYLECRWTAALAACDRAEVYFREHCTGVSWELDTIHAYALWALSHQGHWAELARRFPLLINEARERGDLYAVMNLSTYIRTVVMLGADEPKTAREEAEKIEEQWSHDGNHVQHNDFIWSLIQVDLYSGDGAGAWERLSNYWPDLARSLLLRVQFIRVAMVGIRARCALAAHRNDPKLVRSAEKDAARLERERLPWADAQALMIRATLAEISGRRSEAKAKLEQAASRFRDCDMFLCASVAERRLGEIQGGPEGAALVRKSDEWLTGQGVVNPSRVADLFAPGFPHR
ncbi:serine/threonine-protein kinase PknK [Singulisphaera sp. PoT]|uniref:serine/threonine-protein kinase n=1 Tax=Singulisphaera sp. PoT TaxID=3411797 RepID=UPI003BF4F0C4